MLPMARKLLLLTLMETSRGFASAYEWTWANPLPQNHALNAVVWSGSKFLAVGDRGAIVTSADGKAWMPQKSGVQTRLHAAVWADSQFVVVGDSGTILTSADAVRWIRRDCPGKPWLTGVGWDGKRLIATGGSDSGLASAILYSRDGADWEAENPPSFSVPFQSVYCLNGRTILTSDFGSAIYLPDSSKWGTWEGGAIVSLAWSGSRYIGVGPGSYATSADGSEWFRGSLGSFDLRAVVWDGRQAIAVGTKGAVYTTTDGQQWTPHYQDQSKWYGIELYGLASNGVCTIAVGRGGVIFRSVDGVEWIRRDSTLSPATLQEIAWGSGNAVAVGDSGVLLTSKNGIDWVRPDLGPSRPYDSKQLESVVSSGETFVAAGQYEDSAWILTSRDGLSWTSIRSKSVPYLSRLHWTGKVFLGVEPATGAIFESADGVSWVERFKSPGFGAFGFASNGKETIALGSKAVAISEDGLAWTIHGIEDSLYATKLLWTGGRYVAISRNGPDWTSTDGLNWTKAATSLGDIALLGAVWTGSEVVAVGYGIEGGVVASSPDGISWGSYQYVSDKMLNSAAWTGQNLIVVGDRGAILTTASRRPEIDVRSVKSGIRSPFRAYLRGQEILVSGCELRRGSFYGVRIFDWDGRRVGGWSGIGEDGRLSFPVPAALGNRNGRYILEIGAGDDRDRKRGAVASIP